jgi:hypothetical protein
MSQPDTGNPESILDFFGTHLGLSTLRVAIEFFILS